MLKERDQMLSAHLKLLSDNQREMQRHVAEIVGLLKQETKKVRKATNGRNPAIRLVDWAKRAVAVASSS
jgi:hypothetical protein